MADPLGSRHSDVLILGAGSGGYAAALRAAQLGLSVTLIEVTTVVYDLAGNGKSQIMRTAGGVKVIRRGPADGDGPVVGVHLVGDRVGELIGEAQLMVGWEALPSDVTPLLHAHPTQNEALGEAILALAGTPLHAHGERSRREFERHIGTMPAG